MLKRVALVQRSGIFAHTGTGQSSTPSHRCDCFMSWLLAHTKPTSRGEVVTACSRKRNHHSTQNQRLHWASQFPRFFTSDS